jgi:hypothetical protein
VGSDGCVYVVFVVFVVMRVGAIRRMLPNVVLMEDGDITTLWWYHHLVVRSPACGDITTLWFLLYSCQCLCALYEPT